ncbi:substrate-binding domain-containing protein [Streptomyces sp. NA04227]|uniref:PstS family phosphate ABC transporter substrate-binding protein n=1 Tax=Streptomyces sp. NA04227 TaxID=2742136 RepID=UPI001590DD6A|nr:substrate-binding domain-containing protein [Streptomyces sp. NA04227]QKW07448.1 substrate-binding domain-containing protein [Streptomyces sp. NA04227]
MDWLSPENVIALATALIGVVATFAALIYERSPRRRHIGYRVQMDTYFQDFQLPSGRLGSTGADDDGDDENGGEDEQAVVRSVFNPALDLTDPTLVLLRIENDGAHDIEVDDYNTSALRGLTVRFTGRHVHGCAVLVGDGPNAEDIRDHLTDQQHRLLPEGDKLHIPRVALDKGDHFKLVVLLSGGNAGGEVKVTGRLRRGKIGENKSSSSTLDSKPQQFTRPARVLIGLLTVCVVTLASLVLATGEEKQDKAQSLCAEGDLRLIGSSAFTRTAEALKKAYEEECPGARIEVATESTDRGARELDSIGKIALDGSPPVISFSDGPLSRSDFPRLQGRSTSVAVFTLIVHDDVKLKNLTLAQVRDLYAGRITNWNQIPGGPDLPVVLASRGDDSGTGDVLRRQLLDGHEEKPGSDPEPVCNGKVERGPAPERCALDSTRQVLEAVGSTRGAIGYAELRSSVGAKGMHTVSIDGRPASVADIATSGYPYRSVEYAYTYGTPKADSLTARFLNFMTVSGGSAEEAMRRHLQLPCAEPEALQICAPS